MQFYSETEYQNHPWVIAMLEAYTSGLTLDIDDIAVSDDLDELPSGFLVAENSEGLGRWLKTSGLYADASDTATSYSVPKGLGLKAGQFITDIGLTGAAVAISAIDTTSNTTHDVVTVDATIGVALTSASDAIVEAVAAAAAGSAAYKYTPKGLALSSVDLEKENMPTGVMVRGSVSEENLPFPVNAAIKALMPLIRFD